MNEISFLESAVVSHLFAMSIPTTKAHFNSFSFSQIIWQKHFEGDIGNDSLVTVDGTDFAI